MNLRHKYTTYVNTVQDEKSIPPSLKTMADEVCFCHRRRWKKAMAVEENI
jgi:hypothetical protein